ncbi:hypothetical protein A4S02_10515 [Acetobacter ascendens]|uniref:Uncharacterized protein n=1 Tax=Acetobacter ascendens TaxID=481146 RepID=A0A1D8QXQ7_9PROT|nr:hypothetical protein A4S02_10515 [Acetobacter ascendens]
MIEKLPLSNCSLDKRTLKGTYKKEGGIRRLKDASEPNESAQKNRRGNLTEGLYIELDYEKVYFV